MAWIRSTLGKRNVVVASQMQHVHDGRQGRECERCGSRWTVRRDGDVFHVWRNNENEDSAILDWFGNNVTIECCEE